MVEIRVLTVPLDPRSGLFDDGPLRAYLADREVLRSEPHFFVHEGRACCALYLETRLRQGAQESQASRSSGPVPGPFRSPDADREAFNRLLSELDETERARYDRLLQWRRDAARREGVPHYVLMTNRQALEVARRATRTLEGILREGHYTRSSRGPAVVRRWKTVSRASWSGRARSRGSARPCPSPRWTCPWTSGSARPRPCGPAPWP